MVNPWALVVRGILALIFGLVLAIWPGITLEVAIILFPLLAILDGSTAILLSMSHRDKGGMWSAYMPMGIIEIIIGIVVLIWPEVTVAALALLMGMWAFVLAAGELIGAFTNKKISGGMRVLLIVAGIITIILGLAVISYPLIITGVLIWLFGVFFIIYGIAIAIIGFVSMSHTEKSDEKTNEKKEN